ncbi:predicted protein [Naegleria gruberi]|uniref:Predicted protein n=1 Tax=Naegleria gruberi TaxID=5762 RepID=D2VZI6_NAEGR|nr:uncharacterized protein NAEGRDRAFT_59679 [Naegleria gruberi]EFC37797.1 predicted protein [Naegleria gruberi]|eukprot:XP_002670541.1 predicted protein [Naegleria gruberi strain NEG-M]
MLARMKEHKHASQQQQQANSQQQQQTTNSTTVSTTTTPNSSNSTSPATTNTSSLNSLASSIQSTQNPSPVIVGTGSSSNNNSQTTSSLLTTAATSIGSLGGGGLQNYDDDNNSKKRSFQEMEQTSSSYSRTDDSSKFNKSSHPSNPSNLHHYDENNDEDDEDLDLSTTTTSSYNKPPPTHQQGSSSSSTHSAYPSHFSSSNNRPVAPPSKVLLFSNLPPNCQKSELLEFDTFNECKFQKVFLFKQPAPSGPNRHNNKKRKRDGYLAFVEFESVEKAQMFLDKFEGQKIKIRNRTAYLKFSEKQQLEGTPGGLTMNVNEDLNTVPVSKTVVNTNNATIIHITFTHCDEYNYPLNVDLLFNLFSKFGTIEKINIFIKNELTQSLVQFKSDTEATEAVKEMEGVFVYPEMKLYRMNIQFSKKSREELLIKETNHRNRDYVVHPMRSQKPYDGSGSSMRYNNNTPSNNHYAPPPEDPYYVSESSNSNSPDRRIPGNDMDEMMHNRRKSPPPYMSSRDSYPSHHFAQPSYNNYPPPSSYYPPPSSSSNGAMMIPPPSSMHSYNGPNDYMGSSGFPPMGGPPPMPPQHHGVPQPHHGHPQQFPPPPSYSSNGVPPPMHMPMFPPGTCVVIVKNLPVQCTCDHLFVLFGLYGDVIKVSISLSKKDHKTPYMAFIQFKYPHEVGNALRFLGAPFYPTFNKYTPGNTPISSGSTLFGKELHIEPSFRIFDIIPPRSSKSKENDGSKDILFRSYENSPLHRFTPRQGTQESYQANMKKLMNICPPSPVLHISNVSGTTTEDKIRREIDKLFESPNQRKQKSRIVDFKFIDYKKTQTSDHKMKEKKSAIIEMDSIDAATTVLVELHDISIDSHHLNIKFSNRSGSQSSSQSHYDSYYQNDQRSNNNRPPRRSSDRMPQQDTMMGENQDN